MLREMIDLNAQQARFAEADTGRISLAGGPGSGKTLTLVSRVLPLLLRGVRPDDIVLLTPHDHRVRPLQQHLNDMPRKFQERRRLLERQGWNVEAAPSGGRACRPGLRRNYFAIRARRSA